MKRTTLSRETSSIKWQVVTDSGNVLTVPNDKARTRYECVETYGINAVLERVKRVHSVAPHDVRIVITPSGDQVTQF